ncbi:MAG: amidohydrolase family protein [Pseudomonadota bacterium]|uniref:amidohydrolase family protein n=1 Tax=Phenylobacterium sp. TaxID=1871053 RepID=UPI0025F8CC45|nr:amidohydrolase family protein [Phenylobacterium sp.]MBT9473891.1 amidohydrolase family protein [Phenylobacterium sp.]
MKRTLIRGGYIVSVDAAVGDFPVGDLLVVGDRIAEIAPHIGAAADEVIDARNMIVMPGLINAHLHTWQTGLRSIGGGWTGPDYHKIMHGNLGTRFLPDDNYIGTLLGALEQLNGGVTTLFDWCHDITDIDYAHRSVDALEEAGIRAVFGHGSAKPLAGEGDVPFTHKPHPRARLEALRKGRFASDDRLVTLAAAILGPQFSTPEVVEHDFRMVKDLDLLSSSHAARRPADRVSPEGFFIPARLGLLNAKHNVVHGNYLSDEELKLIVDCGASVTVTANIELHVHPADPVTGRLRALGAMPSLGVDSIPAANSDLFNEMRLAMLYQRSIEHRVNHNAGCGPLTVLPVPSRDVLEWATIGGARALCMEDQIGSLTPGKKADIILIDGLALNMFPVHDPVHTTVQQANFSNVDTVLVDGVVRKRGGKLLYDADTLTQRREALRTSVTRIIEESGYRPVPAGALS